MKLSVEPALRSPRPRRSTLTNAVALMELTKAQRNLITSLRDAAQARGATVNEVSPGHFHINGKMLVNYWPFSDKRSAYVAGTTHGKPNVGPKEAVDMAFTAPPIARPDKKDSRGNQGRYKRWKLRMYKRGLSDCYWCSKPCTIAPGRPDSMTVDHKVPLHRGGLDNTNNWVIAHHKCNQARGHDMPELSN